MNAIVTFGDLLKPYAPLVALHADHCSNCNRYLPDELFSVEEALCNSCSMITRDDAQIWECSRCEALRMWGFYQPYEKSAKYLGCTGCGEVRKHYFAYVTGAVTAKPALSKKQAEMTRRSREEVSSEVADANWRTRLKAAIWAD